MNPPLKSNATVTSEIEQLMDANGLLRLCFTKKLLGYEDIL